MKLFINAGGKGERLYPLTKDLPKPLVEVCGKPVLVHLIEWAKKNGISEIVMMNGHMSEKIINYFENGSKFGIKIIHSNEPYRLGSGGALKFAKKHIDERFVYISGDHVCDVDLKKMVKFHEENKSHFTALVHKSTHPHDSDLLVSDGDSKIVRFVSKDEEHINVGDLSNSGLCIIEPEIIEVIDSINENVFNFENHLYPLILKKDMRFFSYQTEDFISDMGTLEGLKRCEDYLKYNVNNLSLSRGVKAVILVGGLGKRFRPITETVPKPMIEINGKPFLEFKIESLKKEGINDIVFCVSHLGYLVEEYFGNGKRFGVNIEYSYESEELLGTAGAIKNAEHLLGDTFIAMNGDTFIDIDIKNLLKFHENHNSPLTMVVSNATHPKTQELVEMEEENILNIYKRETTEHEDYLLFTHKPLVNGGIYVFDKKFLENIPSKQHLSIEKDIFSKNIEKIKGFLHEGYMLDISDESDWREFKKDVRQGLIMPSITGYQKIIRSRAPVRITFGGGGTDISPYDERYGGVCINATINRYVYCSLKLRDDKKINIKSDIINLYGGFETYEDNFESMKDIQIIEEDSLKLIKAVILDMNPCYGFDLYVRSEITPHSGLGASASLCVSIIGVLNHLRKKDLLTRHEIAERAFEIERDRLGNIGGRQDQYAAVFGGINLYEFKEEKNVKVNPISINKNDLLELEKNLLVVSSGKRANSSGNIHREETAKGFFEKEDKIRGLHGIKDAAIEMEFNLRRGNLKKFGELIVDGWERKKEFNPDITNTYIDALVEEARMNGAVGVKLMGAGGGGHLLIYSNPDKEHKIREVLAERGAKSIDFSFDFEGLIIWEVEE